jgi:hypothetical protein
LKQESPKVELLPPLYNIFTSDIPTSSKTLLATFADDTAILASDKDPVIEVSLLQPHLNKITQWAKKWKIKINEEKSIQVNFSLSRNECSQPIPIHSSTKYLGIILDKRLTWIPHIKSIRKQANSHLHLLKTLLKSKMYLIYKATTRPVWSCGIHTWGPAKPSNIRPLQVILG